VMKRQASVYSGYSDAQSTGSVIMRVMARNSIDVRSNRSFISGSSMGGRSMASTILRQKQRRKQTNLDLNRSRHNASFNGSVRSGSHYGRVQVVDGASEVDDNESVQSSSFVKMMEGDADKIFHLKGRQISATVEEVDEDKHEESSVLDNGSFVSGSGKAIINFEVMFDKVRNYEVDFQDNNTYVLNYKNNVSYFAIQKAPEVQIVESYLIITKRYLYLFDVSVDCDDYPLLLDPPLKIDEIGALNLSLTNTLACALRTKRNGAPVVVLEDDTMEDFVTFLKATFGTKVPLQYGDQIYAKNQQGREIAFNLVDMRFFDPKDLKTRFNKPRFFGFLEKVSCNWRSKVSSLFGGGLKWVRKMYVLRQDSMYVYDENNYDKPAKVFSIGMYTLEKVKNKEYNKNFVFKLLAPDEEVRVYAAPDENDFNTWIEVL